MAEPTTWPHQPMASVLHPMDLQMLDPTLALQVSGPTMRYTFITKILTILLKVTNSSNVEIVLEIVLRTEVLFHFAILNLKVHFWFPTKNLLCLKTQTEPFVRLVFVCYQVCDFIHSATTSWIPEQEVPYATYGSSWVGYDDKRSFSSKVGELSDSVSLFTVDPLDLSVMLVLLGVNYRSSGWPETVWVALMCGLWTWMTLVGTSAQMEPILWSTTSEKPWVNFLSSALLSSLLI